ncbi:MAG: hypothetical protein PHO15_08755 [Eubacteriales bacterium]|nr:hypothetical protein [Eubacteriales bacterium]
MENIQNTVQQFLVRHQMFYRQIDLDQCLDDYVREMEAGLNGEESSLPMLPAYVAVDESSINEKKIISIDAGGTNLRVALVSFDKNGECRVEEMQKYRMPGIEKQISSGTFFEILAGYVSPLLHATNTIVISFAYPAEITPAMDGKIIRMVKEIKIDGIQGSLLGERLKESIIRTAGQECHVFVTNDTVATCLAGIASAKKNVFGSYIGFVLGTGINSCYIEKVENIKKLKAGFDKKSMIINVESANYNRQPKGDIDILFDQTTIDPGHNSLEKMVSGGYLGALVDDIIRRSAKEGLFSSRFYEAYEKIDELDTIEIGKYIEGEDSVLLKAYKDQGDKEKLFYLIKYTIKRAAKLAALQVAGAAVKCGEGASGDKPVCITAEGSTYYKLKGMKDEIERYLQDWLRDKRGIFTKVIQVEHAVIKGAAIAGLFNGYKI